MRSPPKILSLVGVFDGCGGGAACCDDGGGGVKLRWRVPTDERGDVPCGSPPTMTAGRATTTPSAVGLPPPYAFAPDDGGERRPPMPDTAGRGDALAGDDGVPVRDAATGIAGRDGVRFGRDCVPPIGRGTFAADEAVRAGGCAGAATRGGGAAGGIGTL